MRILMMKTKISSFINFLLIFLAGYVTLLPVYAQEVDGKPAFRTEEEDRTIRVYKETSAAVVFISTTTLTVDPYDLFLEVKPQEGTGSGFIIDAAKGTILTNLHVIENAQKIEILLEDSATYRAKLLGYDQEYDIAVLQIINPPAHLVSLKFADSSKVEIGQRVLAIGNPFGLNRTLTTGVVSSLDRSVKGPKGSLMKGLIQTDAAINPGNSGGPLLDSEGRVIGINSAILSQSGDSAGIGFAIPINQIRRVLPELIATGKVLRPKMGWILVDTNQGPMVRRVLPDGPAEAAGVGPIERIVRDVFRMGFVRDFDRADLIYSVNGVKVRNKEDVEEQIAKSESGKEVTFTMRRGGINGKEREVKIKPVLG
jgi:S1-C subfamily serine protease